MSKFRKPGGHGFRQQKQMKVVKDLIENSAVKLTTVVVVVIALVGFMADYVSMRNQHTHDLQMLRSDMTHELKDLRRLIELSTKDRWSKTDMVRWSAKTERANESWESAPVD